MGLEWVSDLPVSGVRGSGQCYYGIVHLSIDWRNLARGGLRLRTYSELMQRTAISLSAWPGGFWKILN